MAVEARRGPMQHGWDDGVAVVEQIGRADEADGRQAGRVPLSCLARRRVVEGGGLVGRGVR
jgi:hypothetical protein